MWQTVEEGLPKNDLAWPPQKKPKMEPCVETWLTRSEWGNRPKPKVAREMLAEKESPRWRTLGLGQKLAVRPFAPGPC